jgi:hypothetical protein
MSCHGETDVDVTVGDDADRLVILGDHEVAEVLVQHRLGEPFD